MFATRAQPVGIVDHIPRHASEITGIHDVRLLNRIANRPLPARPSAFSQASP